jgi:putative restriction endonuclease
MINNLSEENPLLPISNFDEIIKNVYEFNKVYTINDSITFDRYGTFYNWYYFPEIDLFAPSKFIGYRDTLIDHYIGEGDGGITQKNLEHFFDEIDKDSNLFTILFNKLEVLAQSINKTISRKTLANGGLYIPKNKYQHYTLTYYLKELSSNKTNYFIFDSYGTGQDIDFEQYHWDTTRFNRVKENDLFIYRKPGKSSFSKEFYFFGAGKIGEIKGIGDVTAKILKPLPFNEYITQQDLMNFDWKWKQRNKTWEHFFNQYGMNQIPRSDFINIIKLSHCDYDDSINYDIETAIETHNKIENDDYFADDKMSFVKIRAQQNEFSKSVKLAYNYSCGICGIKNKEFLIGSHIIPWADNKEIRLDPSNGICLCVFHDRAFDRGFIYIDNGFKVHVTTSVIDDEILIEKLNAFENKKIFVPKDNKPKIDYLEYHYSNIFKK